MKERGESAFRQSRRLCKFRNPQRLGKMFLHKFQRPDDSRKDRLPFLRFLLQIRKRRESKFESEHTSPGFAERIRIPSLLEKIRGVSSKSIHGPVPGPENSPAEIEVVRKLRQKIVRESTEKNLHGTGSRRVASGIMKQFRRE